MAEKTAEQALNELDSMRSIADLSEIPGTLKSYENLTIRCFEQWRTRKLSATEENYLELVSQLELQCVNHYLDAFKQSKATPNIDALSNLFRAKIVKSFEENLDYIQDETNDRFRNKSYRSFMNMIDARSLAYRLCEASLKMKPNKLTDDFIHLLNHQKVKNCLDQIVFKDEVDRNIMSTDHHRFFLGCTTLAIGSFKNAVSLLAKGEYDKYIYRVCKYIRIVLAEDDFYRKPNQVYILRGLFVLLANCIKASSWIDIVNHALSGDHDKQRDNPFNIDFFQKIFDKLLGCVEIQNKTLESAVTEESLLVDAVLIFLHIWFYVGDKSDEEIDVIIDKTEKVGSEATRVAEENVNNEITKYFRADQNDERRNCRAEIVYFYINSNVKCDRTRLMSFSILFKIADDQFFQEEHKKNPKFGKELIDIIFDFMRVTAELSQSQKMEYNGIPFELHLKFLFSFTVQDFIKQEVAQHINALMDYAKKGRYYTRVLRIIRRLCSQAKISKELSKKAEFNDFLQHISDKVIQDIPRVKDLYEEIKRNLSLDKFESEIETENLVTPAATRQQAFISYSQKDMSERVRIVEWLTDHNVFHSIWVDTEKMQGNIVNSIIQGIRQSTDFICLVSENYVQSDVCRRELDFAINIKKELHCIVLKKEFKISSFDWAIFQIGTTKYYRADNEADMERFLRNIRTSSPMKNTISGNKEQKSEKKRDQKGDLGKSIKSWTRDEVRHWCEENGFHQWIKPLERYNGLDLFMLNSNLTSESSVKRLCDDYQLQWLEVQRFQFSLSRQIENEQN